MSKARWFPGCSYGPYVFTVTGRRNSPGQYLRCLRSATTPLTPHLGDPITRATGGFGTGAPASRSQVTNVVSAPHFQRCIDSSMSAPRAPRSLGGPPTLPSPSPANGAVDGPGLWCGISGDDLPALRRSPRCERPGSQNRHSPAAAERGFALREECLRRPCTARELSLEAHFQMVMTESSKNAQAGVQTCGIARDDIRRVSFDSNLTSYTCQLGRVQMLVYP